MAFDNLPVIGAAKELHLKKNQECFSYLHLGRQMQNYFLTRFCCFSQLYMELLFKFIRTQADPECSKLSDKLYSTLIILHISLYRILTMNI